MIRRRKQRANKQKQLSSHRGIAIAAMPASWPTSQWITAARVQITVKTHCIAKVMFCDAYRTAQIAFGPIESPSVLFFPHRRGEIFRTIFGPFFSIKVSLCLRKHSSVFTRILSILVSFSQLQSSLVKFTHF